MGELPKPTQASRYDAVTACGVLVKNHFPASAIREIVAFLKPGGYLVTAMRKAYYTPGEECGYHAAIQQDLLESGACELVKTESFVRGLPEKQNVSGTPLFAEQESVLFVLKKAY